MLRILQWVIFSAFILGGWAWAREDEMLNHHRDAEMQEMQDASCPASSDPSGGG